ncbi:MAG TPA: hypothetical protein VGX25_26700 [Actinophytocola sp.]|uniref:hypothetical protein n=1 Tax=Actinophytocola sp. TaxID=1872138 RepID=UPI002DDCF77C|nr:hypothetical protein [Actinophytocola sp.]HEV2782992.1 hypothetical protein [Actinophytocola sp.]
MRGRSTGRDYYDVRARRSNVAPIRPITSRDAARLLRVAGLTVIAAGAAAWVWLILAFVSSISSGDLPDDAFGARLSGIPLGSGGLVAIVAGVLLATVGSWLARAAYGRRERIRNRGYRI